jgi:hypothetical protein
MTNNLEDELQRIVESMDNQESQDNTQTPHEDIQDVYVLIVKESEEDHTQIVESKPTPATIRHDSFFSTYVFVCFSLFLSVSVLILRVEVNV